MGGVRTCRIVGMLMGTSGVLSHAGQVGSREGVTRDWVLSGSYELEVATERVPCEVTLSPLYDPTHARLKS